MNKEEKADPTTKVVRAGLRELIAGYRALAMSVLKEGHYPKEESSCLCCRELCRAKKLLGLSGDEW